MLESQKVDTIGFVPGNKGNRQHFEKKDNIGGKNGESGGDLKDAMREPGNKMDRNLKLIKLTLLTWIFGCCVTIFLLWMR